MKFQYINKILILLTVGAVLTFGASAFADWGTEYGHHGSGWYHQGWKGSGCGYTIGDLSEDAAKKLEEEYQIFLNETKKLRQDLYSAELALRSELAKENIDSKKAASIQKEISKLEAQIDQKQLDHLVKIKKINPNAGGEFTGRRQMGYGYAQRGSCWR